MCHARISPFLLSFLLLAAIAVVSFHHHPGFQGTSTCVICKVAKDLSTNEVFEPYHAPILPTVVLTVESTPVTSFQQFPSSHQRTRAPPAVNVL